LGNNNEVKEIYTPDSKAFKEEEKK